MTMRAFTILPGKSGGLEVIEHHFQVKPMRAYVIYPDSQAPEGLRVRSYSVVPGSCELIPDHFERHGNGQRSLRSLGADFFSQVAPKDVETPVDSFPKMAKAEAVSFWERLRSWGRAFLFKAR